MSCWGVKKPVNRTEPPNRTELKITKELCLLSEPNHIVLMVLEPNHMTNISNRN